LVNEQLRGARILFILAPLLLAFGLAIFVKVGSFSKPMGASGPPFLLEFSACIALGLAPIFLIIALAILPTARQTSRDFEDFRAGRLLAHWTYDSDDLSAYAQMLHLRWRKWARFALAGLILIALALAIASASGPFAWANRYLCFATYIIWGLVASLFLYTLSVLAIRAVLNSRYKKTTHAFISKDACNFSGRHVHWNTRRRFMHVWLEKAEVSEDEPARLVLTIHTRMGSTTTDSTARIAIFLAAAAAALAGHTAHGAAENAPRRIEIPIPAGQEDQARAVAQALQKPAIDDHLDRSPG
jgi:hypothetical protein